MQLLVDGQDKIHDHCIDGFWPNQKEDFILPFTKDEIEKIATENVMSRVTIPGVQPKISLSITETKHESRITIVGALQGNYILKPPHDNFPQMPEIESLSMHLSRASGIQTVPFSLIPLQSGELAYLTKRIDRNKGKKIAMEDFCQLSEKLTEHKYRGSHEQVAKLIKKYTSNDLLEIVKFYEIVLVSYLIGNADMHLKNFSLIKGKNGYTLAPAYDMLSTKILIPQDNEELALTLNGKKNRLNRDDFEIAMNNAKLPTKAINNLINRILEGTSRWPNLIENSFLSPKNKLILQKLIQERVSLIS